MARQYPKPPIVEAVIALTFAEALDPRGMAKIRDQLQSRYPSINEQRMQRLDILPEGIRLNESANGYRLADREQQSIVLVTPTELATSSLPPYSGWDAFRESMVENFHAMKETVGYRKITRLGVRYINRIDIPDTEEITDTLDYVTIAPFAPRNDFLNIIKNYYLRFDSPAPEKFEAVIQSGTAEAPVLGHFSILFDIDLSRTQDLPQKEPDLWMVADIARDLKNKIFESGITDKSRALFER